MTQAMSHNNGRTFRSYVSSTIGIDTQNLVLGLPEDKEYVDATRAIGFTRNTNAPQPYGPTLGGPATRPQPHLLAEIATKNPNLPWCEVARRARKIDYRKKKQSFFTSGGQDIEVDLEDASAPVAPAQALPSPLFQHMLRYNTLQAAAIDVLWSHKPTTLTQCEPLQRLADPSEFRPTYPHLVQPLADDKHCPYCRQNIAHKKRTPAALHILDCYCRSKELTFCFDCAKFYKKDEPVDEHVHLIPSTFCGTILWYGLVIRPGRCPLCPQSAEYFHSGNFKEHLDYHIQHTIEKGSLHCQNCQQQFDSEDRFRDHFIETHGITKRKTRIRD
ncbi:hypothetical protein DM02DRAFT_678772 [Periconia macrospinosa]|uniref:C2H2-type domain-containing protein n=1 Tax=Periconia macrospinosa TaxID=97972 RepID=A0A2V1CWR1_9PLEO|nr:hypothetical protein DM02DRAFT_678772 [Periconia macrospinosa]